jgi:hypothetical protein
MPYARSSWLLCRGRASHFGGSDAPGTLEPMKVYSERYCCASCVPRATPSGRRCHPSRTTAYRPKAPRPAWGLTPRRLTSRHHPFVPYRPAASFALAWSTGWQLVMRHSPCSTVQAALGASALVIDGRRHRRPPVERAPPWRGQQLLWATNTSRSSPSTIPVQSRGYSTSHK